MTQSNQPTTDQMNEAIAVFNGWVKCEDDQYGAAYFRDNKGRFMKYVHSLEFETSWDLLMPIWNKLRTTVQLDNNGDYPAEFCAMSDVWENACFEVNIANAHYLIHDAIQWYNQQNQTNGQDTR